MDRSREDVTALIAEADGVVADCRRYLEAAEEVVDGIPDRRAALERRLAPFWKLRDEAWEELKRVRRNYDYNSPQERIAEDAYDRASTDLYHARQGFGGDDFDKENRKAVARHLVSLVREDSDRRLDAIAARGEGPGLREALAARKDEVFVSTHYLTRRFAAARSLLNEEVRTTRAEAHNVFDVLKNPPVDR